MRERLVALLSCAILLGCAGGSTPPGEPSQPLVPISIPVLTVLESSEPIDWLARWVQVNDFTLDAATVRLHCEKMAPGNYCEGKLHRYTLIHPYFLKRGKNTIASPYNVGTGNSLGPGPFKFAFRIDEGKPVAKDNELEIGKTLVELSSPEFMAEETPDEARRFKGELVFDQPVPVWRWTHGIPIRVTPENQASLYAAYKRVFEHLRTLPSEDTSVPQKEKDAFVRDFEETTREFDAAWRLSGSQFDVSEHLLTLARTRKEKIPLVLRGFPAESDVTMSTFAGGTLARLRVGYASLVRYVGGAHDAPRGQPGPVDLGYDLWFRMNDKSEWILDAAYPLDEF